MQLPKRAYILEVGPRDGFQAEKAWIPTEQKIQIVNALARTGLPAVQVTSFVHPKAIPQLADAEEVLSKIERVPGVEYRVLVPNLKGIQRALALKPDKVHFMNSVTESHSRANANRSVDEGLAQIREMFALATEAGVPGVGGMACALGCPFEGKVPIQQLGRIAGRYVEIGIREIGLADTIGVADPRLVYDVSAHMLDKFPQVTWSLHLHNTRDMAMANVVAALQAGITRFDASIGGLGGCPYAPGAAGNASTEDMVNMLHEMGVETGIDLDGLIAVAKMVQEVIPHPLDSCMVKAGKRTDLKPAPKGQEKIG